MAGYKMDADDTVDKCISGWSFILVHFQPVSHFDDKLSIFPTGLSPRLQFGGRCPARSSSGIIWSKFSDTRGGVIQSDKVF